VGEYNHTLLFKHSVGRKVREKRCALKIVQKMKSKVEIQTKWGGDYSPPSILHKIKTMSCWCCRILTIRIDTFSPSKQLILITLGTMRFDDPSVQTDFITTLNNVTSPWFMRIDSFTYETDR